MPNETLDTIRALLRDEIYRREYRGHPGEPAELEAALAALDAMAAEAEALRWLASAASVCIDHAATTNGYRVTAWPTEDQPAVHNRRTQPTLLDAVRDAASKAGVTL